MDPNALEARRASFDEPEAPDAFVACRVRVSLPALPDPEPDPAPEPTMVPGAVGVAGAAASGLLADVVPGRVAVVEFRVKGGEGGM